MRTGTLKWFFSTDCKAGACRNNDNGSVTCSHTLIAAHSKVKKARGINKVNIFALIFKGSNSAVNADFPLFLLTVKVQNSITVTGFADSFSSTGNIKQSLAKSCFTLGCVACKNNISYIFCLNTHKSYLLFLIFVHIV